MDLQSEIEIHEPNEGFNFEIVSLTTPTLSSGGNYFIKFHTQNVDSLYIQPPKCTTKQGIIKTNGGKKMYCDLVFSNTNENFIKWIEDLEKYSQEYIFKNREKWFESHLELEDIENSFTPSLKIYKSGKSYILRTVVPTRLGKCGLKIFNEDETEFNIEDFKETTNVITILEVQGIRCSSKSFQIEIEIKQMMILKPVALFEKCIIKSKQSSQPQESLYNVVTQQPQLSQSKEHTQQRANSEKENIQKIPNKSDGSTVIDEIENSIIDIKTDDDSYSDELTEIEFDLEKNNIENDEPINIKDRSQIFKEVYERALEKAKEARNLAIYSYLEAKRIKNLYLLNEE